MTLFEKLQNIREDRKLLDYDEYGNICESPLTVSGNWNGDKHTKSLLGNYYKNGFLNSWTKLNKQVNETNIKDLEFYYVRNGKNPNIINCVGVVFDPTISTSGVYEVLIALVLVKYDEEVYKGKDIYQTTRVQLSNLGELNSKGLATSLYSSLVESGYILICDQTQYDGARNLWRKLSHKYIVDVFDYFEGGVTKQNHKIIKTNVDDLDEEWSATPPIKHENILFTIRKDKNI